MGMYALKKAPQKSSKHPSSSVPDWARATKNMIFELKLYCRILLETKTSSISDVNSTSERSLNEKYER